MNIQHRLSGTDGEFFAEEGGTKLGELLYTAGSDNIISILHTEVFPGAEGKGLGKELVLAAAGHARAHGLRIVTICPYAKKVLERSAEHQDLLHRPAS